MNIILNPNLRQNYQICLFLVLNFILGKEKYICWIKDHQR